MTPKQKRQAAAAGAVVAAGVVAATLLGPSGPVTVHPGDDVARVARGLKAGSRLVFAPGTYPAQVSIDGLRDVSIDARGAMFTGCPIGLKLSNFQRVAIDGGEYTRCSLYGLQAVNGSGLTLHQPYAHDCGKTGILTGSVDDVAIDGGESSRNQAEWGVYLSQRCRKARISGLRADANGKGAIQTNLDSGGGSDITIDRLTGSGNQRVGGGAAINMSYVDGGSVTDSVISDHYGRAIIALWGGAKHIMIDRNSFGFAGKGTACVSIDRSADGVIGTMNQPAPGVPLSVREK